MKKKSTWYYTKKNIKVACHSIRDMFYLLLPIPQSKKYKFAFLVHPRNIEDSYRRWPFFRWLPKSWVLWFLSNGWPMVISNVTGLRRINGEGEVPGFVVAMLLPAEQMLEDREKAVKKIRQAVKLAKKHGAKIIGLGGLTASLTKGGEHLLDMGIHVTTGHAYTAYNVTANVFEAAERFNLDLSELTIGIVGAAGSIGSTSAKILARFGVGKIILVELERKHDRIADLPAELRSLAPNELEIELVSDMNRLRDAHIVVTATNAVGALVEDRHIVSGTIIVDDAQPSDVHDDLLRREDVLVLEAGVVHTPGVLSHFNFGLKGREDNFCCMAEIMILAAMEWNQHYVIHRATLEAVDEMAEYGRKLDFRVGDFQNRERLISVEEILKIHKAIEDRLEKGVQ